MTTYLEMILFKSTAIFIDYYKDNLLLHCPIATRITFRGNLLHSRNMEALSDSKLLCC